MSRVIIIDDFKLLKEAFSGNSLSGRDPDLPIDGGLLLGGRGTLKTKQLAIVMWNCPC